MENKISRRLVGRRKKKKKKAEKNRTGKKVKEKSLEP